MKPRTRTLSTREIRRMGERELNRQQRERAIDAFWALTPEERAQRMADNEAFQRISKNGITLEDLHKAEDESYLRGVKAGKEGTIRTCFAAICLALHEQHGFGKERCSKVLNDVYERICYALTSQEAIQEVYDTIGLQLDFGNDITQDAVTGRDAE